MATFIVIALSVGGLNNKIYESGDVVTEACFPAGNADKLVKGGFLRAIGNQSPAPAPAPAGGKPDFDSITKAQIIELLNERNPKPEFKNGFSKKDLYDLL